MPPAPPAAPDTADPESDAIEENRERRALLGQVRFVGDGGCEIRDADSDFNEFRISIFSNSIFSTKKNEHGARGWLAGLKETAALSAPVVLGNCAKSLTSGFFETLKLGFS